MAKKKREMEKEIPLNIIVGNNNLMAKEAFNKLKDNVLYFLDNGDKKIVQIESSIAGEGKSTTVANLAVMLAKSGKKVAIMDLDFHKPKIHKAFKIPNTFGIIEYILGECSYNELVKTTEYGVDIFNRGKSVSNSAVIFTGANFKKLVDKIEAEYDVVLLDCPPVLLVSDYIHITQLSDGVLFVVSFVKARRSQVKNAVAALRSCGANIIGTAVTFSGDPGFIKNYGAYYKGYKKYYGEYEGE